MKQFFRIVFGGLLSIALGILLSHGTLKLWNYIQPQVKGLNAKAFFSEKFSFDSNNLDGVTSISGITRTIRFSASEEEELIDSASRNFSAKNLDDISAKAYVVGNLNTGTIFSSANKDTLTPIASLTKLVTAVIARRMIDPDKRITLTRSIMATYGNTAQFMVGETFVASDLLYPLLMVSSNDVAEAYALSIGRKRFIQAMNDFVQSIGAYRTYFRDPSGLSALNVSTPNDLIIIADWIRLNDPEIFSITQLKSKTIRSHTWVNPAHFLNWSDYLGGKNGYTEEANRTGLALFALGKDKEPHVVVVLGSSDRDGDVVKLLKKVR